MSKRKLYELVNEYHIGTSLCFCAEAMFKACNEYYKLNLSEETRKNVFGYGNWYADRALMLWSIYSSSRYYWIDDSKRRGNGC